MLKLACFCVLSVVASGAAVAADVAAGKAIVDKTCSKCHVKEDQKSLGADALSSAMKDFAAGKTKHKVPVKLTDEEIANVVAYWTAD